MNGSEKNAILVNYSDKELAAGVARELKPFISYHVNQILDSKAEGDESPLTMSQAADFLKISRTTFSKIINRGEIVFKSLNPDNPKAKKLFKKKNLRAYLESNKSMTIEELKAAAYGTKKS